MPVYDAIVIGCGGMGSAALFELARRGHRVLGLEQFPAVHGRGSSHGQTRVIRTAYYEHPDYVPILHRAWDRWYDLEQRSGKPLLVETGCLSIGPAGGELVAGVRESARVHGLVLETRDPAPFRLPDGFDCVYESKAGYLMVEDCVRAHLERAVAAGATLCAEEAVRSWKAEGDGIAVRTATETYHCAKLVVAAGAWAARLLADLGVPLAVMRQVMLWFEPREPERFRRDRFPVFLYESPRGAFYGMPMIDARGVKVARHYGAPELASPDDVDWTTSDADETPVRAFLDESVSSEVGRCMAREVCQYTLTPDRHFVIDRHPGNGNVVVAAGFSGHGFKFAPVVGEILAELVESGTTRWPIEFLRATRFGGRRKFPIGETHRV